MNGGKDFRLSRMKDARQIYLGRLVIGAALNVALLLMIPQVAVWSSVEREFRLALTFWLVGDFMVRYK